METLRNGKFSITLGSKDLQRGLRKKVSNPRDVHGMTVLSGLVSQDGILSALDDLSRIDSSIITDSFPYPQLFVLANYTLVCSSTKIYEYVGGILTEKLTVVAASTWKVVDYIEYIVLTNGSQVVTRDAMSGTYAVSAVIPAANAVCNYNGQLVIGGSA